MKFRHHPDKIIYLNDFQCTIAEFLEQFPDYSLPDGYISREYDGINHILRTNNTQSGGPVPWEEGDGYINNINDIIFNITSLRMNPRIPETIPGANPQMVPNYAILRNEINNDPLAIGYADKTFTEIADLINAKTQSVVKSVPMNTVLKWAAKTGVLMKLSIAQDDKDNVVAIRSVCKAALLMLTSPTSLILDINDAEIQGMIAALVAVTIMTQAEMDSLLALGANLASRAEVLWGEGILVTARDVKEVLSN